MCLENFHANNSVISGFYLLRSFSHLTKERFFPIFRWGKPLYFAYRFEIYLKIYLNIYKTIQ